MDRRMKVNPSLWAKSRWGPAWTPTWEFLQCLTISSLLCRACSGMPFPSQAPNKVIHHTSKSWWSQFHMENPSTFHMDNPSMETINPKSIPLGMEQGRHQLYIPYREVFTRTRGSAIHRLPGGPRTCHWCLQGAEIIQQEKTTVNKGEFQCGNKDKICSALCLPVKKFRPKSRTLPHQYIPSH